MVTTSPGYTQQGCKNGSSASDQGMMVRLGTDQEDMAPARASGMTLQIFTPRAPPFLTPGHSIHSQPYRKMEEVNLCAHQMNEGHSSAHVSWPSYNFCGRLILRDKFGFPAQESPCGVAVLRHGQPALPLCGLAKRFRKWNTGYVPNGKTVRDSIQRWSAKA
ncbi:hypothetical protein CIHG_03661 [Coccidioides immitis H538.4]|uniref:Uncharacterized protein n=2 Tax=Coccidioides immitis TaxID=5501 RepID=A0A0J8RLX6_COCIT|nr:hypothetical protein CIRG_04850 [Coccidioides immitis RMSCC 2394]KMU85621.1 hypothetical protein CIHG_03661 [Coccidioides immitis H538.4]